MSDNKVVLDSSDVTKAQSALRDLGTQLDKTEKEIGKTELTVKSMATAMQKATADALNFDKAGGKVGSTMKDVAASFNPVTLAASGLTAMLSALSVGALKSMVMGVVESRAELYHMSIQTGISVEALSGLKSVAMGTGTTLEDIAAITAKFNKAVGASNRPTTVQAEAFKNLGISVKDTNGNFKDTLTLQQEAAKVLNEHSNGIEKDTYYMTLWGKGALANKEYLMKLGEQGEIHGKITLEQAKKAEELEKQLLTLSKAANEFKAQLADELVPWLTETTKGMNELLKSAGSLKVFFQNWDLSGDTATQVDAKLKADVKKLEEERHEWEVLEKGGYTGGYEASHASRMKQLEDRIKQEGNLLKVLEKEEQTQRATDAAALDHGKFNKPVERPALKALKVGKEAVVPTAALFDATGEYKKQTDELIKLQAELDKYNGIQTKTNLQILQANIDLGEYNQKLNAKKEVVRTAATAEQLAIMKVNAAKLDAKQIEIDLAKYEAEAWKEVEKVIKSEQDKLKQMRQTSAETEITRRVMKAYGATQDDVTIAISDYNIVNAQTALTIGKLTNVSEQELTILKARLETLKEMKHLQQDNKDSNDAEILRQRQFSTGWETAFNKYQDDATNASKQAETVFATASKGMEDALTNFATTSKLSFSSMVNSMLADIARMAAKKAIANIFSMFASSADGNVFGSAGILKSANGNVFDSPTLHGYAGGIGMLGEAGPEAILPLKRDAQGKLGVATQGGTAAQQNNITVQVTVQGGITNDQTGNAVATKVQELFTRGIVRQELMMAQRTGGMLNPI